MKKFGYTKKINATFSEALIKLEIELKNEGFGILSKIDMKSKFKDTINEEIDDYLILGTCNPSLAFEAISTEYEIGLLLPCNIIVYSKFNDIFVSSIMPTIAMNMIYNDDIKKVAKKAEKKLKKVIDSL